MPQPRCQHLLKLLLLLLTPVAAHTYPSLVLLEAILLVESELRIVEGHLLVLDGHYAALPSIDALLLWLFNGDVPTSLELVNQLSGFLLVKTIHVAQVGNLFVLFLRELSLGATWWFRDRSFGFWIQSKLWIVTLHIAP